MKINRWIRLTLECAVSYALLMSVSAWLFDMPFSSRSFIGWLIGGALIGGAIQLLGDLGVRKLSKNNAEKDFSVIQNRKTLLLLERNAAFDLCKDSLAETKVKSIIENKEKGFIKATTKLSFNSFGTQIEFKLYQITDNLTEVELQTRPSVKTTMVDYGESLKIIEEIIRYLKEKDADINKKVLADSTMILEDVYVKPFQKKRLRGK